ncbi:uncharacterized protein LOC121726478 isoform X2 [Aricia agestis]|uniref:uncharacterized protein LOC121726478 isoform X2 n=1 Tax=Aricia agestis TaxID=91739 RepID=UPI001C208EA0|nr:uncharacterized protein LOC121726478 isoform X2 [Aricia agestis]
MVKRINNPIQPVVKHDPTQKFITWYKHMIDYERPNLCLYLSDNITLDWFGRTIRTRKKVTAFLKYDMECTRHDFRSAEKIEKIQTRDERDQRVDSQNISDLAAPLSPEDEKPTNKRKLRSGSPEWEESSQTVNVEFTNYKSKRFKRSHTTDEDRQKVQSLSSCSDYNESNKGDDATIGTKLKRTSITPTNIECGQGDCIPSTSGTDSDRSHDALNAQLPKLAVECNGYVEFTRSRNNSSVDTAKWDRKCKVQISYSEDCLNPGEYIIWALCYNDGSKCRRNLLAAFEEAKQDDEC